MDRSIWSTLAVHYATDPDRLERLMPLLELAADRLRIPNLTIVLEASHRDLPPADCAASRRASRSSTPPARRTRASTVASGTSILACRPRAEGRFSQHGRPRS